MEGSDREREAHLQRPPPRLCLLLGPRPLHLCARREVSCVGIELCLTPISRLISSRHPKLAEQIQSILRQKQLRSHLIGETK